MFAIIEEIEAQRNYEFPYASSHSSKVVETMDFQIKAYKFRISNPSKIVQANLEQTLNLCRDIYNAALQERRDAYKINRTSINYYDQANQLSEIKTTNPEYKEIHSQVLQDVLKRLDKTFKAFYARAKKGQAGFPRFKGASRFDSFCFPQSGFSLTGNKLTLSKIGTVKLKLSRKIQGKIKTLTIKRECGRWFAIFTVETKTEPLPHSDKAIGIDVGLENYATYTEGEPTPNPRFFETLQSKLRVAQRKVSRRKKGSHRRRKAILALRKIHQKIKDCRNDFQHKLSTKIVSEYGTIAVEDLNILGMSRGILSKQILDASWASFLFKLQFKAENAGRIFRRVNPNGTSQTCICGAKVKKKLSVRRHHCLECGLSAHRDSVSASVILSRAGHSPSGANVNRLDYAYPENPLPNL